MCVGFLRVKKKCVWDFYELRKVCVVSQGGMAYFVTHPYEIYSLNEDAM